MAREFLLAYHSYLDAMDELDDAERGRLFTALLTYSSTGEVTKLTGNERFVFPMLRRQIDMDIQKYEAKCEANRENGKRGGRPKKAASEEPEGESERPSAEPTETDNKPKKPDGFSENQTEPKKTNANANANAKGNIPILSSGAEGEPTDLEAAVQKWINHLEAHNFSISSTTKNSLPGIIKIRAAHIGESEAVKQIERSISAGLLTILPCEEGRIVKFPEKVVG